MTILVVLLRSIHLTTSSLVDYGEDGYFSHSASLMSGGVMVPICGPICAGTSILIKTDTRSVHDVTFSNVTSSCVSHAYNGDGGIYGVMKLETVNMGTKNGYVHNLHAATE